MNGDYALGYAAAMKVAADHIAALERRHHDSTYERGDLVAFTPHMANELRALLANVPSE